MCVPLAIFPLSIFRNDKLFEEQSETNNKVLSTTTIFQMKNNKIDPNLNDNDDSLIIPNKKLIYRDHKLVRGIQRVYQFINSPLVKYINHFVSYNLNTCLCPFFILFSSF